VQETVSDEAHGDQWGVHATDKCKKSPNYLFIVMSCLLPFLCVVRVQCFLLPYLLYYSTITFAFVIK